mmetsp:Transcript_8820/g.29088  ORF Transcript_8820/g.29088 Transcript_8820/m.29088 type:complete len:385 (-) Transcript_8820:139-1293(-)
MHDVAAAAAKHQGCAAALAQEAARTCRFEKFVSVAFYLFAGPFTIFVNKFILTTVRFPYGAALSFCGITTSTIVSAVLILLGSASSEKLKTMTPAFYVRRVMPIGLALAGTLATGNAAYLYNSVAFVQMLKAFSPVILLLLLFATRLERPRALLVAAIVIISFGTGLSAHGEVHMSGFGVGLMFVSEAFEALKLVNMQLLLGDSKFESVEGIVAVGPAAMVCLALVSLATEDVSAACSTVAAHPSLFLIASFGGVAVNFSTSMVVRATSALTLRILGLLRNLGIIVISAAVFADSEVTALEYVGLAVSLSGMALYSHAKSHPNETCGSLRRRVSGQKRRTYREGEARSPTYGASGALLAEESDDDDEEETFDEGSRTGIGKGDV